MVLDRSYLDGAVELVGRTGPGDLDGSKRFDSEARCSSDPGVTDSAAGTPASATNRECSDLPALTLPDPDREHRRWAGADSDRQAGEIEPPLQPGGVASELNPCDAPGIAADAGIRNAGIAADEERQVRLVHRLGQAGQAGAEPGAPDRGDRRSQAPRDGVDVIDRHDPAKQAVADARQACQKAAAEVRAWRLLRIGHSEQLEIAASERHDPVVRPESLVASTAAGQEP